RGVFELLRRLLHGPERTTDILALADRIARELHQRTRTEAFSEELGCQFGQLMCLVDDERLRTRQDFAESLLLERQVGKQQVVVDDDQIRRLRALASLHDEAFGPEWAFVAQAVLGRTRHHRQQWRIL